MDIIRDNQGRFARNKKRARARGIVSIFSILVILTIGIGYGLHLYGEWSAKYERVWQQPVLVKFQKLTFVRERDRETVIISPLAEHPKEAETDIERYICDVFGVFNCQVALAVMKAESGGNSEAWNSNNNGTLDIGLWQINSINWDTCGMSMSDLLDPYKNTDCAKMLYVNADSTFTPWVVFNTNGFVNRL